MTKRLNKPGIPTAPRNLSAEARSWWVRINTQFVLEDQALLLFEQALRALDRCREAQEILRREGIVLDGKAHPAVAIERDAMGLVLRTMRSLGLDLEPLNDAPGRPHGSGGLKVKGA